MPDSTAVTKQSGVTRVTRPSQPFRLTELADLMEGVAKRIWDELVEPCSVAELCEVLLTHFVVDRETCQREVLAFLTALHQQDLIVVSTAGMAGAVA